MSNLTEEFAVYKNQLDQWIKALGLSQYQPSNSEIEKILEFTRETLREQSSIDLSESAVLLAQYALFLQQKTNECHTFLRWSSQVMGRLFGDDRPKISQWIKQVELRKDRIAYLTRRIEIMGQSISGLVRARYNEGSNR